MRTDTQRYRVVGEIGRGQRAVVLAATDTQLGRNVALKRGLDASHDASLRAEAHRLAQVHSPHVVAIHDVLDTSPVTLVLERLEGQTVRARLQAAGRLPLSDLTAWVSQLFDGLAALNAADIAHGDLKPENLWIGTDDRLRLLDVGAGGEATAIYAAPEVGLGQAPTPVSDLYAAATVVWEMLAGRPPFDARDAAELAARKRTRNAPAVGSAGVSVPPAVEAWLARGLDTEPRRRFADAASAGRAWREAAADAPRAASIDLHPAATALVRSVVETARRRTGAVGVVVGLPGSGKSAALAAGVTAARALGVLVIDVRRAPAARRRPFVDWHVAVRRALRRAPELARGLMAPIGARGEAAIQARVTTALRARAARGGGVLVCGDEPALCDGATRRLLLRLAEDARAGGFAVVFAADAVRRGRTAAATYTAIMAPATEVVELGEPDEPAWRVFVAARLGVALVSDALSAYLRARTHGNPKLAVALLQTLRHAGALRRVDDAWVFRPERASAQLPPEAIAVLERGLGGIPRPVLTLLETAAVHGVEFPAELVAAAAALPATAVEQTLHDIARLHGVVRRHGAGWRFVPALLADALRAHWAPVARAEVHARFATALQATRGAADDAALGLHLHGAGLAEQALPFLERAAQTALERDPHTALECATRACEAADARLDSEAAARRRVELGLLRARALHALAAWDEARRELDTTTVLARAWGLETLEMRALRAQGQAEYARSQYDDAVACYLEAQACASRLGDAAELHELALQIGNIHFERGALDAAAAEYERALVWAEANGEPDLGARAANNVALVESLQGRKQRAVEYFNRSLERFVALGRDTAVARINQNIGQIYFELRNWAEARNFFRRAIQASERTGEDAVVAVACLDFAEATLQLGDAAEAAPAVERALAISRDRGDTIGVANAQRLQARLAAAAGDITSAETLLADAIDKLDALGEALHLALCWKDLGWVRLQAGRRDAAAPALEEARRRFASLDAPQHAAEVDALRTRCREETACRP